MTSKKDLPSIGARLIAGRRLWSGLTTQCLALLLLGLLVADSAAHAAAPAGRSPILWGVAESGLELGKGMKAGTNYAIPNPAYYLAHNVRLIRLPFQIGRIQPQPQAPLDSAFVAAMKAIIRFDQANGAVTVIDPHGYGFYNIDGQPRDLLSDPQAAADYVDLMRRIAVAFAPDDVAIGLMNEPHTASDAAYAVIWNRAIAAIRAAGFTGTILVPHAHWSNAGDISPAHPFTGHIIDPLRNWVLELHLYLDPDGTGTYRQAVQSAEIGYERLAGAIAWSRQTGIKLFLGETGGPSDAMGMAALHLVLNDVAAAPDAFWGIALWGAGAWWKPNYPMRLDPINGVERPQFLAFEETFIPEILYVAKPDGQPPARLEMLVDGVRVASDITVTADVTGTPQSCAIPVAFSTGSHRIAIRPLGNAHGTTAYVLGSTWRGVSNSRNAFAPIGPEGYVFEIIVPRATSP